ncbi:hypothetical protein LTR91_005125 [Friedmanniomyces endolithicus]|uniref:Uncharacterized protein n=1 Tax=Friedmanniomyces endolithicus TaxID=329885 RepID=A0AAN6KTQ3_9PEZI|nr:hypothetical protein LTR94_000170 [Friedmanniomyces endolithicus]KAK0780434.1 hypothetical protein LTR75_015037 [Friedmanniomyces endolithicus]KAK0797259.1 hypothetical protein LTR59_006811 [Friedmanniomyces endolithicus]KAK0815117.1 hypothetical protein LTR38_002411 [Friedmanniomyces endolithicus]KAK0852316.1 hypothetical protein LTR03_003577 [Friedmanniomyces endolithicus]
MTEATRLSGLPGYDTAPDVYETPDLTDDAATTTTTLPTSPRSTTEDTDATSESDDDDNDDLGANHARRESGGGGGVSKRRLYPERARRKFGAASGRVEVEGLDLSDRVDGGRKGYRVRRPSGRRTRRGGFEGVDGEEEGLEERLARLRREVEECRVLAGGVRVGGGDEGGEGESVEEVDGLGRLLASSQVPVARDRRKGQQSAPRPPAVNGAGIQEALGLDEDVSDEQTLSRVADFDTRLSELEQALGISSLDAATADALSTPVLPSLTALDQQLSALASATSLTHLEAASSRIQKLRGDAEQLSQAPATRSPAVNGNAAESDGAHTLSQDDMDKLQLLFQLLPNLQSLSPTVPALLARLRSLRTLHASAADAAAELDEVERRQAQMDEELAQWRDGLSRVEKVVGQASEANGLNGRVVDEWVKDLEGRVRAVR